MSKITLSWDHYCSAEGLDEIRPYLLSKGGVYLWVIEGKCPRVAYVGVTKNFHTRTVEHLSKHFGSAYFTLFVNKEDDYLRVIEKNLKNIDKKQRVLPSGVGYIPHSPADQNFSFTRAFLDRDLHEKLFQHIKNIKFAFCSVDDMSMGREVESILIQKLVDLYKFESNIPDLAVPWGKSNHHVIGSLTYYAIGQYDIEHSGPCAHLLPVEVTNIRTYSPPVNPKKTA